MGRPIINIVLCCIPHTNIWPQLCKEAIIYQHETNIIYYHMACDDSHRSVYIHVIFLYRIICAAHVVHCFHTLLWSSDNSSVSLFIAEDLLSLPNFDRNTPTNVSVYQGDTARLLCSVYNLQGKKVRKDYKKYM